MKRGPAAAEGGGHLKLYPLGGGALRAEISPALWRLPQLGPPGGGGQTPAIRPPPRLLKTASNEPEEETANLLARQAGHPSGHPAGAPGHLSGARQLWGTPGGATPLKPEGPLPPGLLGRCGSGTPPPSLYALSHTHPRAGWVSRGRRRDRLRCWKGGGRRECVWKVVQAPRGLERFGGGGVSRLFSTTGSLNSLMHMVISMNNSLQAPLSGTSGGGGTAPPATLPSFRFFLKKGGLILFSTAALPHPDCKTPRRIWHRTLIGEPLFEPAPESALEEGPLP